MTKQEVREHYVDSCCMCTSTNCDDCEIPIVIECIKKQIPRKPNKVKCLNGKFAYLCPTCGGGLISMCRCHYAECGQAILWESDK